MKTYTFKVTPMGAVRMTQSDKWNRRDVVMRYFRFKDDIREDARKNNYPLPDDFTIRFYVPMPKSYSKKKRLELDNKPHQEKPDKDNLTKAFTDALYNSEGGNDKKIWHTNEYKYWTLQEEGWIEVDVEDN